MANQELAGDSRSLTENFCVYMCNDGWAVAGGVVVRWVGLIAAPHHDVWQVSAVTFCQEVTELGSPGGIQSRRTKNRWSLRPEIVVGPQTWAAGGMAC